MRLDRFSSVLAWFRAGAAFEASFSAHSVANIVPVGRAFTVLVSALGL